jgi:hypothetical protein
LPILTDLRLDMVESVTLRPKEVAEAEDRQDVQRESNRLLPVAAGC